MSNGDSAGKGPLPYGFAARDRPALPLIVDLHLQNSSRRNSSRLLKQVQGKIDRADLQSREFLQHRWPHQWSTDWRPSSPRIRILLQCCMNGLSSMNWHADQRFLRWKYCCFHRTLPQRIWNISYPAQCTQQRGRFPINKNEAEKRVPGLTRIPPWQLRSGILFLHSYLVAESRNLPLGHIFLLICVLPSFCQ